jgi:hypothetical protein
VAYRNPRLARYASASALFGCMNIVVRTRWRHRCLPGPCQAVSVLIARIQRRTLVSPVIASCWCLLWVESQRRTFTFAECC